MSPRVLLDSRELDGASRLARSSASRLASSLANGERARSLAPYMKMMNGVLASSVPRPCDEKPVSFAIPALKVGRGRASQRARGYSRLSSLSRPVRQDGRTSAE